MMEKVAVIMSTYNGERFIREQIDSILAQEGVEPLLVIRDDGSTDGTTRIIEEYSERCGNVVFQNRGEKKNLGVRDSFLSLLEWAIRQYPDINFFAFSDQDDFWKKEKLAEAVRTKSANPKWLYFSNKTIVDEERNILYDEHLVYYHDVLEIFWGSQASGCTMVFSRSIAENVLRCRDTPHRCGQLHDSLFYRVSHVIGADITFDERSFILYRQHGNNVIGIEHTAKTGMNWYGLLHKSPHFISTLAGQIRDNYQSVLNWEGKYYLDLVCGYQNSFRCRWKLILDRKARSRGFKLYAIWVGKLLLQRL
ncbi:MAG: glycosyltransferase [Oscillibacter sp.]|nr:glycosyltransferase [Oscillibacter sp.]